jgi:hypothetical protein
MPLCVFRSRAVTNRLRSGSPTTPNVTPYVTIILYAILHLGLTSHIQDFLLTANDPAGEPSGSPLTLDRVLLSTVALRRLRCPLHIGENFAREGAAGVDDTHHASDSLKMPTICSSVKRDFFRKGRLLRRSPWISP